MSSINWLLYNKRKSNYNKNEVKWSENKDRVFEGIIEQSGRDHIIVSNPTTGEWYLILMIYLDFVTFDESINFIKDFT